MGNNSSVDHASEPECRPVGPHVHIPVEEVQLCGQGEEWE